MTLFLVRFFFLFLFHVPSPSSLRVSDNRMENGTAVQGSLTPSLRQFTVQYIDRSASNITIDQLIPMVDGSTNCRQYISWKCYAAPMNSYSSTMTVTSLIYWKNRYYETMGYWGDTTTTDYVVRANSGMTCSCGEKKSCGRVDLKCACDFNDAVWRNDSGYLTQSIHLPVTTYCVTDTGASTVRLRLNGMALRVCELLKTA